MHVIEFAEKKTTNAFKNIPALQANEGKKCDARIISIPIQKRLEYMAYLRSHQHVLSSN